MSSQPVTADKPKRVNQPSSYGNPRPYRERRFYRIAGSWLDHINTVLIVLSAISITMALGLLVYAGIGIKHGENYASDGTEFSCKLSTTKAIQK